MPFVATSVRVEYVGHYDVREENEGKITTGKSTFKEILASREWRLNTNIPIDRVGKSI